MSDDDSARLQCPVSFILATYNGSVEKMLRLAQQEGFDLRSEDRSTGEIALFLAVERAQPMMLQSLVDAGVDVNARDSTGQAALHPSYSPRK